MRRKNRTTLKHNSQLRRLRRDDLNRQKAMPVILKGGTPFWFRIVEVIGIFIALIALIYTIWSVHLTRETIRQEGLARAWDILTTPASGNSGKSLALQTLNAYGISLSGIDLSCEHMNGGWDAKKKLCERPTYLRHTYLPSLRNSHRTTQTSTFTQVAPERWNEFNDINPANFSHLSANDEVDLRSVHEGKFIEKEYNENLAYWEKVKVFLDYFHKGGADLSNANLSGTDLSYGNYYRINLVYADLSGAILDKANFFQSNLLNADLSYSENIGVDFRYGLINNTKMNRAYIKDTDFSYSSLYLSKLNRVMIVNSNFQHTFLKDTNFSGAFIVGADFSNAVMEATILQNAFLDAVKFCDPKVGCAKNLTAEQIKSAYAFSDTWDSNALPSYLKIGPEEDWPHPRFCNPSFRDLYAKKYSAGNPISTDLECMKFRD